MIIRFNCVDPANFHYIRAGLACLAPEVVDASFRASPLEIESV